MTVSVTMIATRMGEDGDYWEAGTSHDATDGFARYLVQYGWASGTFPRAEQSAPVQFISITAAQVAAGAGVEGQSYIILDGDLVGERVIYDGGVFRGWTGSGLPYAPFDTRLAATSEINLAPNKEALWWPLNEGTGTSVTDLVHGKIATITGTTTNAWDNESWLTLNTDTAAAIRNDTLIDSIFTLSTLTSGSLIVGCELYLTTDTSGVGYVWGVGNMNSTTAGGYGVKPTVSGSATSLLHTLYYTAIGGPTYQTLSNLTTNTLDGRKRRIIHTVFNCYDGRVWVDGYDEGVHSRSCRFLAFEDGGSPILTTTYGLRIGARAHVSFQSSSNLGAVATLPQLRNFHVLRVDNATRGEIPWLVANLAATIPYNIIPEAFSV